MGIDFSHGNAHWAYSGFMRFRARLFFDVYGFDLELMEGFAEKTPAFNNYNPEGYYPNRCPIPWHSLKKHPLKPFFDHSDCDGEIPANVCFRMGAAMLDCIEKWIDYPDAKWPFNNTKYDKQQGFELAHGLCTAGLKNEPLIFC